MAWILDEYSKFHGYSPAIVTGKPIVSHKLQKSKLVKLIQLLLIPVLIPTHFNPFEYNVYVFYIRILGDH